MSPPPARSDSPKAAPLTFRISVIGNILLLACVVVLWWRGQPSGPASSHLPVPVANGSEIQSSENPVQAREYKLTAGEITPAAVAQLERLGLSRDVIVGALVEDVNHRTTQRMVALQKKFAPRPVPNREMVELSRQSEDEQARELKQALGEQGYHDWEKEQTLHALNRARPAGDELPMSMAEADQAYRLQHEFDEKARDLQMAMEDGVADKADAAALQAQAQQNLDRELEKLLGTDRFNELRGNINPTAQVYQVYGDMNPTAAQAQVIAQTDASYRARQAALAQQLGQTPGDAQLTAQLKALDDAHEDSLKQIFGADAYEKMKQQHDPTYQTLQKYAEAWQLGSNDVQGVYDAVRTFQDQASRLRSAAETDEAAGQRANWREVDTAIDQVRQKAETDLQNMIGDERFRRLKQNGVLDIRG